MINKQNKEKIKQFLIERGWGKSHTSANLAKSISIEAAEILELFQWNDEYNLEDLTDEIADVAIYLFMLADKNNIDINEAISQKIEKNKIKYPTKLKTNS